MNALETIQETNWDGPAPGTRYLLRRPGRSLADTCGYTQLLDGIELEFRPKCAEEYEMLLALLDATEVAV